MWVNGYAPWPRIQGTGDKSVLTAISIIAEHRIREAIKCGEFDELPCKGKPLDLSAEANIPPELRMAYTLLKNGGYLDDGADTIKPKECSSLESMLGYNPEERETVRKIRRITVMELRVKRHGKSKFNIYSEGYYEKVVDRLSVTNKETNE
jgi:hypothetical protein